MRKGLFRLSEGRSEHSLHHRHQAESETADVGFGYTVTQDFSVESRDISGAFLKGLTFEEIRDLLRSRGISSPMRKVVLVVPRHLAATSSCA